MKTDKHDAAALAAEKFEREERFIVVKRKHLSDYQEKNLRDHLRENDIPTVECVVVESDWPEYEIVWQMIEARCTGRPAPIAEDVEPVAWRYWRNGQSNSPRMYYSAQKPTDPNCRKVEPLYLPQPRQPDMALLERECIRLFGLLDDIDTLDDAAKGNDAAFRAEARTIQAKRFEGGITTDGYTVDLSALSQPAKSDAEGQGWRDAVVEAKSEAMRLRAVICGIVEARDDEDFDGLMAAIDEAKSEAVLSALAATNEPEQAQ